MGFLSLGTPLGLTDTKKYVDYIRKHGILQFLNQYHRNKDREEDSFFWGDEIEFSVVHFDHENHHATLSLRTGEIFDQIAELSEADSDSSAPLHETEAAQTAHFVPEFGRWMIEAIPDHPYCSFSSCIRLVFPNMRLRRRLIQSLLLPGEEVVCLSAFPRLGVGHFTHPYYPPNGPVAMSDGVPDEAIGAHARYSTLAQNIRLRRGSKVDIRVPVFPDVNTIAQPQKVEQSLPPQPTELKKDCGDILMDAMAYGMGCCCIQCTFQACNICEARHLTDQLAMLSPLLMALTAATPILHGMLANTDVRWSVISAAVDDRTPGERGLVPLQPNERRILKSRYDSISCFISSCSSLKDKYNDIPLEIDEEAFSILRDGGVDERLASHIAHLFIRYPLVIYDEHVYIDDESNMDHFENFQSTNWQNVRFKPPPPDSSIGWRVEFRTMEIQITDFENAAFVVFISLVSRAILYFNLNFYIPISKVDENMKRAHEVNALHNQKFYFRSIVSQISKEDGVTGETEDYLDGFEELTIQQIFLGNPPNFPGLIPLVRSYSILMEFDSKTIDIVNDYLAFIQARVTGEIMTTATWIRDFVDSHLAYQHDSVIPDIVNYDLIRALDQIEKGERIAPKLLGRFQALNSGDEASLDCNKCSKDGCGSDMTNSGTMKC